MAAVWSGAGTQAWASGILAQVAVRLRAAAPAEHLRQVGGSEGQIRSREEQLATVHLDVSGLSTLDFSGPEINRLRGELEVEERKRRLIDAAYQQTNSIVLS
ncbi:MAG: hypothetical protein KDB87_21540 [Flavobacteriales bacterium]|nr:hypothetical protein [Flavobacteriales bacterium]MCB0815736.1 hypothetical protein [Flavobacteriales bacterium]